MPMQSATPPDGRDPTPPFRPSATPDPVAPGPVVPGPVVPAAPGPAAVGSVAPNPAILDPAVADVPDEGPGPATDPAAGWEADTGAAGPAVPDPVPATDPVAVAPADPEPGAGAVDPAAPDPAHPAGPAADPAATVPAAVPPLTGAITVSQAGLLRDIAARFAAGLGFSVATLNLDHVVKLRRDPGFRAVYARQTHVVADGNPIVWLQRLAGAPVDLVPGSDLVAPLMALAAGMAVPVALLGSNDEVLAVAATRLEAAHPGLRVAVRIAPPYGFDPEGTAAEGYLDRIGASGARLCLIALGAPKQERLAARGLERLPHCGFVSVGAGLDFVAGAQRRAPVWVRRLALEWGWRLARDWRRMAARYRDCAAILPGLGLAALRARRGGTRD